MEETGLNLKSIKKLGFTNDIFANENKHYVTIFVCANDFSGEVEVKEPNKCKQWQWFELNELPKPLFLPLINFIKEHPDLRIKNN